jgi:murein DD-endopeptidase MepM/ murein hydrolase activator NlpD
VVGAGVVAMGTAGAVPSLTGGLAFGSADPARARTPTAADPAGHQDRTAERASRSGPRHAADSADPGTVEPGVPAIQLSQQPAQDIWQLPVHGDYTISSPFGERWGVLHPGTDLAVPVGTPVYAANAGTVTLCRWNGGYGNNVVIQHDDGVTSVYGHASKLLCRDGEQVQAGDEIALSGNTGYSTGPHLHFELRRDDKPFDAVPFMRQHGVDLPTHAEILNGGVIPGSD